MKKSRFAELYQEKIQAQLQKELGLKNIMQVPRIEKIVLNVGVKEAVGDVRVLQTVSNTLMHIAGQAPVRTVARKSIAGFKIREGMPIGVMVTLRRHRMYDFLDKLINLALPKVRDFHGVSSVADGRGNYNLGIKEWSVFPEAQSGVDKAYGMNVTIHTSAVNDQHAIELLKHFGMPFKKIDRKET